MAKEECIFCEGFGSMEAFRIESTTEEIEGVLAMAKICVPHAQELDGINAAREKREAEEAAA